MFSYKNNFIITLAQKIQIIFTLIVCIVFRKYKRFQLIIEINDSTTSLLFIIESIL